MKKFASIKTRITIWYTLLMLVLVSVVLLVTGLLSYQLALNSVERDIKSKVTQVAERFGNRPWNMEHSWGKKTPRLFEEGMSENMAGERPAFMEETPRFRNVSVFTKDGECIIGQETYDFSGIPFVHDRFRRETIEGEEYLIYDVFRPDRFNSQNGIWIRGVESVSYSQMLGKSAFTVLLFIIPFIVLLTALGGYFITKRAFMPVKEIIKTANEINTSTDIKKRIQINPDARQDELYNLSVTLNRMLDKIENLIVQEKQFTSDASHELRTPVSVILAQGEYLLDIAETEKERELASNIVAKAKQMSKLISALLLLARIDSNRQKINTEKTDLSVLADIAAEGLEQQAEEKNISILLDVPENTIIYADEALMLSAVTNLISNAVKYGKDGGWVKVSALSDKGCIKLVVADNGEGISQEHLEKIWGRFYRVDDVRNDEYGSSGLGLSMVKSIVELHGGRISVESTPGEGSIFTVVFCPKA